MTDNKSKKKLDSKRISLSEPYEATRWAKILGVSPQKLTASVNKVGSSVAKVKEYIKKTK
jgi:hypothetical protein